MKPEDLKGTDIRKWLLQNQEEGYLYHCVRDEKGEGYYFILNWEDAEKQLPHSRVGTGMEEEALYRTDHDQRETNMQDPRREFAEIKTRCRNGGGQILFFCILLKEAHYQDRLSKTLPEMEISFHFQGELKEEGASGRAGAGITLTERQPSAPSARYGGSCGRPFRYLSS